VKSVDALTLTQHAALLLSSCISLPNSRHSFTIACTKCSITT
jgi:hypothetical protein